MLRRNTVILAIVILVLAVAASALMAAEGGPGKQHGMQRQGMHARGMTLKAFAKALNLTEQQTAAVKAILEKLRTDLKAVRDSDKTKEQKMAAVKALRDKARVDIYAVLTPDQKTIADQQRLVDRLLRAQRGPNAALLRCLGTLNLSEAQKTQIKGFMKDAGDQAKAVLQDTGLTPEARRAKLKEIRQAMMEKINSVLTPEQQQKLKNCLKNQIRQPGAPGGAAAGPQKDGV